MICKNCGTKLDDDAKFCWKCGTPVDMAPNNPAPAKSSTAGAGTAGMKQGAASTYSSLNNEETVIMKAHLHWVTLMPFLPLAIVAFIICNRIDRNIIGILIALVLMVDPAIQYLTTTLSFTNKRLIGKKGLLNTHSLDTPLNKINNVDVKSNVSGKFMGYGELIISTSSGSYKYKRISKPEEFRDNLMRQIDQFDDDRIQKQAMEMAMAMNRYK